MSGGAGGAGGSGAAAASGGAEDPDDSNSSSGSSSAGGKKGGSPSGGGSKCPDGVEPVPEECDNQDNDCDQLIDEELEEDCGSSNLGICKFGTRTCSNGQWSDCVGAIEPKQEEICDAEMQDENCDGNDNENCPCTEGETKMCMKTIGVCKAGMQVCDKAGQWSEECAGAVGPQSPKDICDGKGLDEDCDGKADKQDKSDCECVDHDTRSCMAGMGICEKGMQGCEEGRWSKCMPENMPGKEICDGNGLDEDCDGKADLADSQDCKCNDGDMGSCSTGDLGECRMGKHICMGGMWGPCEPMNTRQKELCDGRGKDEDCDGLPDLLDSQDCKCLDGARDENCDTKQSGECKSGTSECDNGKWTTCMPKTKAGKELCDGKGKDEDCDGFTDGADPTCKCVMPKEQSCTGGNECMTGTQTCTIEGEWSACNPKPKEQGVKCNNASGSCDQGMCRTAMRVTNQSPRTYTVAVAPGFTVDVNVTTESAKPIHATVRSGSYECTINMEMDKGEQHPTCPQIAPSSSGRTIVVSTETSDLTNTKCFGADSGTELTLGFEDAVSVDNDCDEPEVKLKAR